MNTIIYLIRHSERINMKKSIINSKNSKQELNEKEILSTLGEKKAKLLSEFEEFQNIDLVFSSNYSRALATAKYIAENNKIPLNIDDRLGERIENIENSDDVRERMNEVVFEIARNNKNKKLVLITHETSITCFFKKYCDVTVNILNDDTRTKKMAFNGKIFFDGIFEAPQVFKLVLDDNLNINTIKTIEFDYAL